MIQWGGEDGSTIAAMHMYSTFWATTLKPPVTYCKDLSRLYCISQVFSGIWHQFTHCDVKPRHLIIAPCSSFNCTLTWPLQAPSAAALLWDWQRFTPCTHQRASGLHDPVAGSLVDPPSTSSFFPIKDFFSPSHIDITAWPLEKMIFSITCRSCLDFWCLLSPRQ